MLLEKRLQIGTAYFFLPFQQENQVHRQIPMGLQGIGQPAQVRHVLAFVISRAPCINSPLLNPRLERVGLPLLDGVHRLHIVVAVKHDRGPPSPMDIPRHDDRMTLRRMNLHLQAGGFQTRRQPFRISQHL